jgi:TatD DNase family protein
VRLVDSHCHLQADRFDDDLDLVIGGARAAGIERILVPGWDLASSRRAIELAERYPEIDVGVGIHPHDAESADEATWAAVADLAASARVVAIGETGLDYDRMFSPVPAQLANLRAHLRLAAETGKPAILHCRSRPGGRDAHDALLAEIRACGPRRPRVVVHSFSGPIDYAETMLELGAVISFSGLVFRKGEETSADAARLAPGDRLLVETDSPFLSPPGAPRRRNAPEWVAVTARWLADARGTDVETLGGALVATYDRVMRPAVERGS